MQRTKWQTLLLVTFLTTVAGWFLLSLLAGQGVDLPPVPWLVIGVLLVISGMVLRMGWAVRQFLKGKKPNLDPIRAARTAVLAKASGYTGSLLAGWYAAQVLLVLGDLDIASRRARAVTATAAVVGALILAAVGLIVEWFCRVPPPTDTAEERAVQEPIDPAPA